MKTASIVKLLIVSVAIGVLQAGCVSTPLSIPKCDVNAKVLGPSEGSATGIMLFNFIPINQNTRFENAYQDAIGKLGGTCMTDVVIQEKWFWAYVLNGYTFTVRGTVVK